MNTFLSCPNLCHSVLSWLLSEAGFGAHTAFGLTQLGAAGVSQWGGEAEEEEEVSVAKGKGMALKATAEKSCIMTQQRTEG